MDTRPFAVKEVALRIKLPCAIEYVHRDTRVVPQKGARPSSSRKGEWQAAATGDEAALQIEEESMPVLELKAGGKWRLQGGGKERNGGS